MATDRRIWFKLTLLYAVGELLPIAVAVVIGNFLFVYLPDKPSTHFQTMVLLGIAGCNEGLINGWIEWKSPLKVVLHFRPIRWIAGTTLSPVAGWLLIPQPGGYSGFTLSRKPQSIFIEPLS